MARSTTNNRLAMKLVLLVGFMLAASFAAVPFYRLFCQLTGFGGIAQRADAAPSAEKISARTVTVSFNADTAPDLPWDFKPAENTITVKLGAPFTTHYTVTNRSDQPIVGTATHNVQPERAAPWFNKVECFCFQEQVLQPGETRDMPVNFFIDPDMITDRALDDVQAVTLSYTFFLAKDQSKAKLPATEKEMTP